jgi:hypothetical protein
MALSLCGGGATLVGGGVLGGGAGAGAVIRGRFAFGALSPL